MNIDARRQDVRPGGDGPLSAGLNHAGIFLPLLLGADAAFVVVHLAHEFSPWFHSTLFSLQADRSYPEMYQYVKIYWIVILLAALWWRTREHVYVAWMLLYAYLLGDDAFQIHERGGDLAANYFDFGGALGLRAQDIGELTVSGAAGLLFLALISILYLRSPRGSKNASKDLTLLFGVIVFFGVVVDMLHSLAGGGLVEVFFGVVEDGGEMFAMSLVCWYASDLLARRGIVPMSLWCRARAVLTGADGARSARAALAGSSGVLSTTSATPVSGAVMQQNVRGAS